MEDEMSTVAQELIENGFQGNKDKLAVLIANQLKFYNPKSASIALRSFGVYKATSEIENFGVTLTPDEMKKPLRTANILLEVSAFKFMDKNTIDL